jgi:hypothetical protein
MIHKGPSVQRRWGSCGSHNAMEVPLGCQQELHTKGVLGVHTGKNLKD